MTEEQTITLNKIYEGLSAFNYRDRHLEDRLNFLEDSVLEILTTLIDEDVVLEHKAKQTVWAKKMVEKEMEGWGGMVADKYKVEFAEADDELPIENTN